MSSDLTFDQELNIGIVLGELYALLNEQKRNAINILRAQKETDDGLRELKEWYLAKLETVRQCGCWLLRNPEAKNKFMALCDDVTLPEITRRNK